MLKTLGTFLPLNCLWSRESGNDRFAAGKIFIDWLSETGQNVWQMLPLSANTWHGNEPYLHSPYFGYGVGLNPFFLYDHEKKLDFPKASEEFVEKNKYWLSDYCNFLAIAEKLGTDFWPDFPEDLKNHETKAVKDFSQKNSSRISYFVNQQAFLHAKFAELQEYAANKKVELWGDMPFYLPLNSPLVWQSPRAFVFGQKGQLEYFSGVTAGKNFGRQSWGHPLYDWNNPKSRETILGIWFDRLDYLSGLFNNIRLDHSIGFYKYCKLNSADENLDETLVGPGDSVVAKLLEYCRSIDLNIFMEDITDFESSALHAFMKRVKVPGMSVLTMSIIAGRSGFDSRFFDVTKFRQNHVFYTSTHDMLPLVPFLRRLTISQKKVLCRVLGVPYVKELPALAASMRDQLVRKSKTLIVPIQDWLLGSERINVPGEVSQRNWNYRMSVPVEAMNSTTSFL